MIKESDNISSSFRSYWSLKKITMGYDEVSSASSEYNFIERNGFGCGLAYTYATRSEGSGKHYSGSDYSINHRYKWAVLEFRRREDRKINEEEYRKKESEAFWEKYNEQMEYLAGRRHRSKSAPPKSPKWPRHTPVFDKASLESVIIRDFSWQSRHELPMPPKDISKRRKAIEYYEMRYKLEGGGYGTLNFRAVKIRQDWDRFKDWRARAGDPYKLDECIFTSPDGYSYLDYIL